MKSIISLVTALTISSTALADDTEKRLSTLESVSAIQQANAKELETKVKELSIEIQSLNQTKQNLQDAILQLTNKIAQIEQRYDSHVENPVPRLDQVITDATTHSAKISKLEKDTAAHSTKIANAEGAISTHDDRINHLWSVSPCNNRSYIIRNVQGGNYLTIHGGDGVRRSAYEPQGNNKSYWEWQIECN